MGAARRRQQQLHRPGGERRHGASDLPCAWPSLCLTLLTLCSQVVNMHQGNPVNPWIVSLKQCRL